MTFDLLAGVILILMAKFKFKVKPYQRVGVV